MEDLKRESALVEGFRQEELSSLRKDMDDLTELFTNLEKEKQQEIEDLKKKLVARPNIASPSPARVGILSPTVATTSTTSTVRYGGGSVPSPSVRVGAGMFL